VQSIAVIAYLGAKKRKTSARALFMMHRTIHSPQLATAARLQTITEGLRLDDQRTESILREHLTLTEAQWAQLGGDSLSIAGDAAVRVGLADAVAEFAPPPGAQIFNV
jgi:ATP-dependent Clp protease protease subunit